MLWAFRSLLHRAQVTPGQTRTLQESPPQAAEYMDEKGLTSHLLSRLDMG